jgi:hypothetical protein
MLRKRSVSRRSLSLTIVVLLRANWRVRRSIPYCGQRGTAQKRRNGRVSEPAQSRRGQLENARPAPFGLRRLTKLLYAEKARSAGRKASNRA